MKNILKYHIYQDRLVMGTNYVIKYRILGKIPKIQFLIILMTPNHPDLAGSLHGVMFFGPRPGSHCRAVSELLTPPAQLVS